MSIRSLEDVKKIAKDHNWILNPNEKIVKSTLKRLNKNMEKFGYFACPCKPNEINEKRTIIKDGKRISVYSTACPCLDSQEEIERDGKCRCNLYFEKK